MFFKENNRKVLIYGDNIISLQLAHIMSEDFDVILLYNNSEINTRNINNYNFIYEEFKENPIFFFEKYKDEKIEYFIAFTGSDKNNIYSSWLAKKYGIEKSFLIINEYYPKKNESLFNIIDLNSIFYNFILRELTFFKPLKLNKLPADNLYIYKRNVDHNSNILGKEIINLNNNNIDKKIIFIKRNNKIIIPAKNDDIKNSDNIYYISNKKYFSNIGSFLKTNYSRKIVIYSEKNNAIILYNILKKIFKDIVIINSKKEDCNILANRFNSPLILWGGGDDPEFLNNIGLNKRDIFIAATRSDQNNLLSSYTVLDMNCKNVFTFLYNKKYIYHIKKLKLTNAVHISKLIANNVKNNILYFNNYNNQYFAQDVMICGIKKEYSNLPNKDLLKLLSELPEQIMFAGIIKKNKFYFFDINSNIDSNDILIFVLKNNKQNYLKKILNCKKE